MCFGSEETGRKSTTSMPDPAVKDAATGNLNFTTALRDKGFEAYKGPQVAGFSPDQQSSFDLTRAVVGNGTGDAAKGLIDKYSGAPAQSVGANTIQSAMSPYMNEYVMRALAPQMQQMDITNARDSAAVNSAATSAGAFGDARAGIEASNTRFNQNVQREGVIGQAYDKAFQTAIGAGSQDVSNKLAADNANATYAETALTRALQGSNALQGLQNQQLGVTGALNTLGGQQTAQEQAKLTAQYNQWLMAQQQPRQDAALVNQTIQTGATAMPASRTEVSEAPNNSGLGVLGSITGALGGPALAKLGGLAATFI